MAVPTPMTTAVHQRTQPVQMGKARRSVDVFGMARFRRNPAIERLPDLTDNHQIVHRALPQWAEYFAPWLRQRLDLTAENIAKLQPRVAATYRLDGHRGPLEHLALENLLKSRHAKRT